MAKRAVGIAIDGLEEAIDLLEKEVPREALNLSAAAVQATAMEVRNQIKAASPKRSGSLRRSWRAKRNRPMNNQVSSDVYADKRGWYWRFYEYGTTKQPERPFVRPVIARMAPKLPDIFRQKVLIKLEQLRARKAKKARMNK